MGDFGYFDCFGNICEVIGVRELRKSSAASAKANLFETLVQPQSWASLTKLWRSDLRGRRKVDLTPQQINDCELIENTLGPEHTYSTSCKVAQRWSSSFQKASLRKFIRRDAPDSAGFPRIPLDKFRPGDHLTGVASPTTKKQGR